jgi:hypothetical protein
MLNAKELLKLRFNFNQITLPTKSDCCREVVQDKETAKGAEKGIWPGLP